MKLKFKNVVHRGKNLSHSTIQGLSFDLKKGEHLSLFCTNEEKAKTLMALIFGDIKPAHGNIIRKGSISAPLGQYGWFHAKMTCRENIHFVCELYGKNSNNICKEIADYTQNSTNLNDKFGTLKASEKRKISLTLSLLLNLDIYIIKNGTGHPDKKFQEKFNTDFKNLLDNSATAVTLSTDIKFLKQYFKHSLFIDTDGTPEYFPNINDAVDKYKAVNQQKRS